MIVRWILSGDTRSGEFEKARSVFRIEMYYVLFVIETQTRAVVLFIYKLYFKNKRADAQYVDLH